MNDDLLQKLMMKLLVDNTSEDTIDFIRDNIEDLKAYSIKIADELNKIPTVDQEKKDYYSFLDTIEIVKGFLNTINPEYAVLLEELVNNGTIDTADFGGSYLDWNIDDNGREKTNLVVKKNNTIEDAFALTHELLHYTNIKNKLGFDRFLFTEAISYLYELLLNDYLCKNGISSTDSNIVILNGIDFFIKKCDSLYYCIDILEKTLSNEGLIDRYDIADDDISDEEFDRNVDDLEYDLKENLKYMLAILVALLIYKDYKKGIVSLDNIQSFNDSINKCNNMESLRNVFIFKPSLEDVEESCAILNDELFSKKDKSL